MIQTAEEYSFPDRAGQNDPCLRWEQVDAYLNDLQARGRTPGTIRTYRRNLLLLFGALPKNRRLDHRTLVRWRDAWFKGCPEPIHNERLFHFCI